MNFLIFVKITLLNLVGPNEGKFGTRFPAMGDAYDKEWRNQFESIGRECGYEERDVAYFSVFSIFSK